MTHKIYAIIILLAIITMARSLPISSTTKAQKYLSQFGYLNVSSASSNSANSGDLMDANTWKAAIKDFQSFTGLNVSGELDNETLELMSLPRCGVRDRGVPNDSGREKRYALQGSRWSVKALTYRISKYPKTLNMADVDADLARAFQVWSKHTGLTFTVKSTGTVHIEIKFVEGSHGDNDAFDGPGGVLAHAFFPVFGGDAHFDDSERWSINSMRGKNLFQVAAHEFGHSLGLTHSNVPNALMGPFYRGYDANFELHNDDIAAIQALYGKKIPTMKNRNNVVPQVSPLCEDPKIDAIFNTAEGKTYVFKGKQYYKIIENYVAEDYPKLIADGWPGLPGDIDAAFTYSNAKTYFFKGSQYWRFCGRQMDVGYPKEISERFRGIPNNLDAAFVWGVNNKIYFFKGTKFWRYDSSKRPSVSPSYPKLISVWSGLPNDLDAALQHSNGYTYFFKGDKYYRLNNEIYAVDSGNPPFPRPSASWVFGCNEA